MIISMENNLFYSIKEKIIKRHTLPENTGTPVGSEFGRNSEFRVDFKLFEIVSD